MGLTTALVRSASLTRRELLGKINGLRHSIGEMRTAAGTTQSHYEGHNAQSYESAFFYEPGAYMENLAALVQDRLKLRGEKRRLLDIGGGTGNFTRMIVKDTDAEAVVIDPFLEQNVEADGTDVIRFVKASAEDFIESLSLSETPWWKKDFHQVLFKEVVHHLETDHRVAIFRGFWRGILPVGSTTPSLLIITRPQRDIDYPLWDEAREVWAQNQPSLEELAADLEQAGFRNIQHSVEAYPCKVELTRWQSMVKARFWSTFSNFTDEELDEACRTIEKNEKDRVVDDVIRFEDRLLFISADK